MVIQRRSRTRFVLVLPVLGLALSCSSARSDTHPIESSKQTPPGPQPDFGDIVQQANPPPPISGGTLAADRNRGDAGDGRIRTG